MALSVLEVTQAARLRVKVTAGQVGSDGQPARPDGAVPAKQVKTPSAQAEVFDDVEDLDGFLRAAIGLILVDDQVYVNVGMDEVAIRAALHCAFNAHQTMFLAPRKHGDKGLRFVIYNLEKLKIKSNLQLRCTMNECKYIEFPCVKLSSYFN